MLFRIIIEWNSLVYLRKRKDFQLIPILVGSLDSSKLEKFGQLLAPYLCDAKNLFVISSDFCHWGSKDIHLNNKILKFFF